jgi:hypothetical protein
LGTLHPGTRKCFEEITSIKGRKMDKQGVDLWMKRMVVESIKGSFNLWINASPRAIGSFEPKKSIGDMQKRNAELGIQEDKKQTNNDLHENLLNDITNMDKELLKLGTNEVQENTVVELLQEEQLVVKRKEMQM